MLRKDIWNFGKPVKLLIQANWVYGYLWYKEYYYTINMSIWLLTVRPITLVVLLLTRLPQQQDALVTYYTVTFFLILAYYSSVHVDPIVVSTSLVFHT